MSRPLRRKTDGGGPAWDHPAYLRVAWSSLREQSFSDAIERIRRAPLSGVEHATRVLAWARLIEAAIARSGAAADLEAFLALHPALRDAELVHKHYSPERLASARARREFVLPDREPLPGRGGRAAAAVRAEAGQDATGDDGTKKVRRG